VISEERLERCCWQATGQIRIADIHSQHQWDSEPLLWDHRPLISDSRPLIPDPWPPIPALDDCCYYLPDAALQFKVVGDRAADRDFASRMRVDALAYQLSSVDQ
jgi:hypothetical protein